MTSVRSVGDVPDRPRMHLSDEDLQALARRILREVQQLLSAPPQVEAREINEDSSNQPPRIAYSAAEFSAMVGLSAGCVRELLRLGEIPATKFGQQWRISDAYVQQLRAGTVVLPQGRTA